MLHHKLHESPQSWTNLHSRLADYYKKLRDDLELSTEQARYNVIWTNFTVEAFYHALCQAPHKLMDTAISEAYALIDTLNVNDCISSMVKTLSHTP